MEINEIEVHFAKHLDFALYIQVAEDIVAIVKQNVLDFTKDYTTGKEGKEVLFKLQNVLSAIRVEEVHNENSNYFRRKFSK